MKYFDDDLSTHTMDFASMKHGFKGTFTLVKIYKKEYFSMAQFFY